MTKFDEKGAFLYMYNGGVSMETISIMLGKPVSECYKMRNNIFRKR